MKVGETTLLSYGNHILMLCPEWYVKMKGANLPPEGRNLEIKYSDKDDPILLRAVKSIQLLK